jgi:hypothetical protein
MSRIHGKARDKWFRVPEIPLRFSEITFQKQSWQWMSVTLAVSVF